MHQQSECRSRLPADGMVEMVPGERLGTLVLQVGPVAASISSSVVAALRRRSPTLGISLAMAESYDIAPAPSIAGPVMTRLEFAAS